MTTHVADMGPSALTAGQSPEEDEVMELESLSSEECQNLLALGTIGRVGISVGALPVVLPVNYALLDGDVVIRTGAGTKLDAALNHAVVAFEIDQVDPMYHQGWSVMVQGRAREMAEPHELERARALPLRPWAPGSRDRFVRISAERVTGRRLVVSANNGGGS
ncbi:MAG: pyridoxamine 5-phosphate oxidase-related FMN-binding protein [Acidimicrobiales bacterium]|nr:pyridoxamine 5-phosphate oxidase-related FMN-binding protein [Acidimicrobiales bacterium]